MQDEEAVGRLTGYMGSMSHVGSLLAAVPWGMVSDQLGRKPVIIFGHVFSGLTVVYFGRYGCNLKMSAVDEWWCCVFKFAP